MPPQWFAHNPLDVAGERATRVAVQLAKDYPSVQGVAFCYGARQVMDLVKQSPSPLKAAVLYHPTFLTAEDIPAIRMPILFNCAAKEGVFTPELRAKYEAELKNVSGCSFIEYPGTEHGFGARPEGELAHKSSAEAAANSCAFFSKHK